MKKLLVLVAVLCAPALQAWDCKYEKSIDQSLDLSGSERLAVQAAAGDLEIRGVAGQTARISGRICVSEEEWLDQAGVETESGRNAMIRVKLPNSGDGWSWTGNNYATLDLELEVPESLPLNVKDSSGDISIRNVAAVSVQDSSGDIEIEDVRGDVVASDSSGDIELSSIGGDVTVENDSSGDIRGERIDGSVLVEKDSSGGIRFDDVGRDFIVERDSSGDIVARGVGGDFRVLRDGSGDIRFSDVQGEVETPDES